MYNEEKCHDCGVKEGQLHREGCDSESPEPFIWYPNICIKCGKINPDLFQVSNDEWRKYIEPRMRDKILCLECYAFIKHVIDKYNISYQNELKDKILQLQDLATIQAHIDILRQMVAQIQEKQKELNKTGAG